MRRSETPYNPEDVRDCLVIIGKHRDISENYNNTRRNWRTQRLNGETRRNTSEKGRKPRKRRRARIWSGEDNGAKRIETAERKRGNPRKARRFEKLRY